MKMEIIQLTWTNVGIKKKQHSWLPGDLEKQWSNVNNFHEKPQITKATTIRQQQQKQQQGLATLNVTRAVFASLHNLLYFTVDTCFIVSLSLTLSVCVWQGQQQECVLSFTYLSVKQIMT